MDSTRRSAPILEILVCVLLSTVCFSASLPVGANAAVEHRLGPPKVELAPILDGFLDEPVWRQASVASAFTQQRPQSGEPASEPTEVFVLYTDTALYLGFICTDTEPGGILHRSLGRDANLDDDDYFAVVLDTFLDHQNGYFLQVNPNGSRFDMLFGNEGEQRTPDWDGVWSVVTRITESGWQGEIEIPWRTLRFPRSDSVDMGINFERQRRGVNEQSQWAPIPRQFNIFRVSAAGVASGFTGIEPSRNVVVRPYGLVRTERGKLRDPSAFDQDRWDGDLEAGLDAKLGISSNLLLDLTVNTDFAQVEVDDELINLTRFPLFFPEKREFFLEKADLFDFGSPGNRMFFSRRIGLDEEGNTLPIDYGERLTGKIGRTDIGVLDIAQGASGETPSRRFDVVRLARDVGNRSSVGVLGVMRSSDDASGDEPTNRALGIDGDFWPSNQLLVSAYGGFSDEDDDGKDNTTWGTRWRYSHPLTVLTYLHESIGSDYNPAVGFVPRRGVDVDAVGWEFTPEPNWRLIRRFENQGFIQWFSRRHGDFESRNIHINPVAVGPSEQRLSVFWERDFERLFEDFPIGDVQFAPGDYTFDYWGVSLESDPSRPLHFTASTEWGDFFDGTRTSVIGSAVARWAPHLNVSFELETDRIERKDRPSGNTQNFDSDILRLRLGYDVSNRLGFDLFSQWSTSQDLVLSQLRAHLIFGEESDLYLVLTDAHDDGSRNWAPRRGEMTLKLSWARHL